MTPILLVTPPSLFLLDQRVFVSLGILRLGAFLRKKGFEVDHLDLSGIKNFEDALAETLAKNLSLSVCITATTPQLPAVAKICSRIRLEEKKLQRNFKIILGGPHVTLCDSAKKLEMKAGKKSRAHSAVEKLESLADVLVSGDGEFAVLEAIKPGAPKMIDADDPKSGLFLTNELYEELPFPARDLVDMDSYHYSIDGKRSTNLISQLGCPFGCGFCGGRNSKSLRKIRTRSIGSVVLEIKELYELYGFTGFMFYDDELNINRELIPLMNALADLQEKLGVEFSFRGYVKSELFTLEQAKVMYHAGFRWLLSGFESGAERILENINKKATIEDNSRTMEIAGQVGLKVKALMSLGHPGESHETIEQTKSWLLKVKPADFDCTVITTYPGTPYYDEAQPHESLRGVWTYTFPKNGDRLHAYEIDYLTTSDYYKGDPKGGYRSYVFTDFLSAEAIAKARTSLDHAVRDELSIPFPQAAPAIDFEHSMGQ